MHETELCTRWDELERDGLRPLQDKLRPEYAQVQLERDYSSWLVPGLFQTREYVTRVLSAIRDIKRLPDDVASAVEARIERQSILEDPRKKFMVLIEEQVVRNGFGGPAVMRPQIDRLIHAVWRPNVHLGVIPANSDRRWWPAETFTIMDGDRVSVELETRYVNLTDPAEIDRYVELFADLSRIALHGADAARFLETARDTLS
ncbi:hypothetical protein BIV57_10850 [Mangrovactinospora gilvigrisea]|uniref:DUF5753 domain-containing protein n=1 Tax=Mangrovactinospora gilvigrisea TaxID=1428644 RepID=A0A1J7BFK1_9ACTN|nr:DUF5753 domain-containing protein [Mangrovactinospora gilvigrisea]OIV37459.1 hypothetical protein BIV57_10850 [Mangrovactinospora gilvigrisea]